MNKFKVGDFVTSVNCDHEGEIAKIIEIDDELATVQGTNFTDYHAVSHLKLIKPAKTKKQPKVKVVKELYTYWIVEKVNNGYLAKNSAKTLVFKTKKQLWKGLDQWTK